MTRPLSQHSLDQRLLREVRAAPCPLATTLAANALLSGAILLQALLLSQTIDRVFLAGASLDAVAPSLALFGGVVVLRAILSYGAAYAAARLSLRVRQTLRERFTAHLYTLGPAFLSGEHSGELVLAATEGVEKLDGYYREYLPGLFTALVLPVLVLTVVLPLDTLTFVVLLVTAPLIPLFMALIGMAAGTQARAQFLDLRLLGAHFLDVMQGLTTLRLFNRSEHQIETIQRITGRFREATMRVLRIAFLSALTLELLATLSVAVVAVEIGVRLLHGGIAFPQALFLLVIAPEFYLPLRALGARFHNATEGKAAAERLYDVLDTPAAAQITTPQSVPAVLEICVERVTFAYREGHPVLRDVSLTIPSGSRVALVGISGSGKTTLASLLLRFGQPDTGQISISGVDLQQIPADRWREQIAWVSQRPYLFNATVAENIRFSRPDIADAQVIAMAQAAGAHCFITALPQGYQTRCGERGLRLSGGQVQRIALARALLREAPLLILDEPTSQLDPDSEAALLDTLHALPRSRTMILITHRIAAARRADRVIVLEGGTVVEHGSPAALEQAGGLYARLAEEDDHAS